MSDKQEKLNKEIEKAIKIYEAMADKLNLDSEARAKAQIKMVARMAVSKPSQKGLFGMGYWPTAFMINTLATMTGAGALIGGAAYLSKRAEGAGAGQPAGTEKGENPFSDVSPIRKTK